MDNKKKNWSDEPTKNQKNNRVAHPKHDGLNKGLAPSRLDLREIMLQATTTNHMGYQESFHDANMN